MNPLISDLISFLSACRDTEDWLYLTDLGFFSMRSLPGYVGRNAATGAEIVAPATRDPVFRPDANLVRLINGKPPLARVFPDPSSPLYSPDTRPRRAFTVTCAPALDPLARDIRTALESGDEWEDDAFGHFSLRQRRQPHGLDGAAPVAQRKAIKVVFSDDFGDRVRQARSGG